MRLKRITPAEFDTKIDFSLMASSPPPLEPFHVSEGEVIPPRLGTTAAGSYSHYPKI
jgi:hypothetical protein